MHVNCVAFGLIQACTAQAIGTGEATARIGERELKLGIQPDILDFMNQTIPLGHGGTPEEAAGAVYLMWTPESDYSTGELVLASGGLVM